MVGDALPPNWEALMRSIHIRVKEADLAATLGSMREWLDHERCNLLHFHHAGDGTGIVVINAGFAADDHAERFQQHFDGVS
jgi:hypothetical protein